MEKQPNVVIKTATLLSSLLLVGGCVSYRAGVFDPIPEAKTTQGAEEKNPAPSDPAETAAKKSDFVVSPGTKAPFNFITTPR